MSTRFTWFLFACLALAASADSARAQPARITVSGRVLTATGVPLAGADVSVSNTVVDTMVRFVRSGPDGTYRVSLVRAPATLLVTARMAGYTLAFTRVTVTANAEMVVPDLRLVPSAQTLPPVRVVAARRPAARESGGFAPAAGVVMSVIGTETVVSGDQSGDPMQSLVGLPGMTVVPDGNGGFSFSFAGLGADQNRLTLNGADFGGTLPRDGVALRLSSTEYDASKPASGVSVGYTSIRGKYIAERSLHATATAPNLQLTTPYGDRLGRREYLSIVSGIAAGPLFTSEAAEATYSAWRPRFYSTSFQVDRTQRPLTTLSSLDSDLLEHFHIQGDSVRHLLSSLATVGLPGSVESSLSQIATKVSAYSRFDFTTTPRSGASIQPDGRALVAHSFLTQARTTYLLTGGSWSDARGQAAGATTLPSFARASRAGNAVVQGFNSIFINGSVANETRSTFSVAQSHSAPISVLPSATIVLLSPVQSGGIYGATVEAAGNGGAATDLSRWSWQTTNETSWYSLDGHHQFKVSVEGSLDQLTTSRSDGRGRFTFNSLEDFRAGNATSYSRSFGQSATVVSGHHAAIGLGDTFSPGNTFTVQYGVRGESHGFSLGDRTNPLIESAFGARVGRLPSVLSISPMAGFTWFYQGRNELGRQRFERRLVGGIRDYVGTLPIQGFQQFASETGLATGARQLDCIGPAVPRPSWATYQATPASVPERCADGSEATAYAQTSPSVSLLAPSFGPPHSWRADLSWIASLGPGISASISAMGALGVAESSPVDLNFSGVRGFELSDEANRPVYAAAASIVPNSGALPIDGSRRFPAFSRVMEFGSGFRSHARSIGLGLNYDPAISVTSSGIRVPLSATYTLSSADRQTNGFAGTTDGNPLLPESAYGNVARHAATLAALIHVPDWMTVSAFLRVQSGLPFTPRVNGDVNGDGLFNDRAFVFDSRATADTAVARGMSSLLSSAPRNVGECLRAQLGMIAGQNSCTSPWSATLNANVTLAPDRFRLQNRGRVQLRLTNVLGGLDMLLHGPSGVRGWGQIPIVDPTLLTVRAFDPERRRYLYVVNQQFGRSNSIGAAFASPFRITLDVQMDLGQNRERAAIARYAAPRAEQGFSALDSAQILRKLRGTYNGIFVSVLDVADSLRLSAQQRDSIVGMRERHAAFRDSIYATLAGFLVARRDELHGSEVQKRWHDDIGAVLKSQYEKSYALHKVLTDEQLEYLRHLGDIRRVSLLPMKIDGAEIDRMIRRWLLIPPP